MNITVKAEIRIVPPPPPKEEVVISMSPAEATLLRNDLRSATKEATVQRYGINRVLNALDELNLPTIPAS